MPYTDEMLVSQVLQRWKPETVRSQLDKTWVPEGSATYDGHQKDKLSPGISIPVPPIGISLEQTRGSRYAPATNIRELIFPGGNSK